MQINTSRPDTPLAVTPEPTPFTVNQQPNKYQATADAAINQVNAIGSMNKAQSAMPPPQTPEANESL